MYYTVSEVAKRLGMSPYTIRYYGKEGLPDFVEHDQNGSRIFFSTLRYFPKQPVVTVYLMPGLLP